MTDLHHAFGERFATDWPTPLNRDPLYEGRRPVGVMIASRLLAMAGVRDHAVMRRRRTGAGCSSDWSRLGHAVELCRHTRKVSVGAGLYNMAAAPRIAKAGLVTRSWALKCLWTPASASVAPPPCGAGMRDGEGEARRSKG